MLIYGTLGQHETLHFMCFHSVTAESFRYSGKLTIPVWNGNMLLFSRVYDKSLGQSIARSRSRPVALLHLPTRMRLRSCKRFCCCTGHFLIVLVWIMLQPSRFCSSAIEERVFRFFAAVIHVFVFFNLLEGRTRFRIATFYSIVFVEHLVVVSLW